MRIMLTDDTDACTQVGERLRREGHEVLTACLPDHATGACHGVRDEPCPLTVGVDVALSSLDHRQAVASAGIVCAHRAAVPVIEVGRQDAVHPDLGPALGRLGRSGDLTVVREVEAEIRSRLERLGIRDVVVTIERSADEEQLIATLPADAELTVRERSALAVAMLTAATRTGHRPVRRNVAIRHHEPVPHEVPEPPAPGVPG